MDFVSGFGPARVSRGTPADRVQSNQPIEKKIPFRNEKKIIPQKCSSLKKKIPNRFQLKSISNERKMNPVSSRDQCRFSFCRLWYFCLYFFFLKIFILCFFFQLGRVWFSSCEPPCASPAASFRLCWFFLKLFFNDFFVLFLTRESRIGTRGWPLFYRNLPAFIELNRVLPGFTGFSSMSFLFER